uniref:SH3 and PX domains 2Aa n=1 Tax=Nothobranchius pienaari TaxID=704102 RepID=A0A1A8P2N3_9TELE
MKRLRFIDDYCRALVRLPPQISQSEEVLRFFETKTEDINPPVECPIEKSQWIHNNLGRDVYVSIADYRGDEETMGFIEGTCLEVLERNPNGWWYCQVQDSPIPRKGWVPSNYLERKK